ncbi:MAG: 50S ribosomal protein L14 [Candidatus Shikimatogenerans sp. Ttur]|uniref:Large ribosomal subunit protein uL14 n=1 Tax=Candidatus Shikimatogenerans sp. Ttur TaxID=3158569 RepID=A0AAU7ZXH8_9FLAO
MIQKQTKLIVTDNSGVKIVKVIGFFKNKKKYYTIGDLVKVTVCKRHKNSIIKKGKILNAIIVRTIKKIKRLDGSYISFDDNACILLNNKKELLATRIIGPIAREIKYIKIIKKKFFSSKKIF